MIKRTVILLSLLAAFLAGCTPAGQTPMVTLSIARAIPTIMATRKISTRTPVPPTRTPVPSVTLALATPTQPAPKAQMCSPLEDISLAEMPKILQDPVLTPHPGQDDGHHGADFAFWRFGTHTGMEGLGVRSVLPGIVAGVANNRNPYGNMVIIETPLEQIPSDWITALSLPTPSPFKTPDPRMEQCSADPFETNADKAHLSLYLLYAHLKEPSPLKIGDRTTCGSPIGSVGNTGMSGNPHLHLEMRVGASNARFPSMAYYDPRGSEDEFQAYCTWRVSQLFQLLDPMRLLQAGK